MGVLRQKCVPTYGSFLNNTNFSSIGFNMSYESYLTEINNESMLKNRFVFFIENKNKFSDRMWFVDDYLFVQEIDFELVRVYRDRY